ncbi:MAG: carboxylesterase family protein [Sandaracinaceae bacterium]|nr:carboxylesterase family protein [Sandaracinaceae bacterium]
MDRHAGRRHPARACPQVIPILGAQTEEDCLYINVHAPFEVPESGAPVLVWIHGGGFTLGEGVQTGAARWATSSARDENIIVVSMNYRLGALGFLSHPALTDESADSISGNYGLLDQVAALEWVRDNIRAFGGDPERVTIAGQSAGGISVCAHLVSPRSAGLFHGAIVESGPCEFTASSEDASAQGVRFAAALPTPCDTGTPSEVLTCLRAASVADILATLPGSRDFLTRDENTAFWGPIVDGDVLPQAYGAAIRAGNMADVPVLAGFTENEGRVFAALSEVVIAPEDYEAALADLVGGPGADADAVIAAYPLNGEDPTALLRRHRRPAADVLGALQHHRHGRADRPLSLLLPLPERGLPAAHRLRPRRLPRGRGAVRVRLPRQPVHPALQRGGADHARPHPQLLGRVRAGGQPQVEGQPEWPKYDAAEDNHLVLDLEVVTGTGAAAAQCEVWDAL